MAWPEDCARLHRGGSTEQGNDKREAVFDGGKRRSITERLDLATGTKQRPVKNYHYVVILAEFQT